MESPVIIFDGVCNLCNASVRFVVKRDPAGIFRFAPSDSLAARTLIVEAGWPSAKPIPDTVLLVEGDRIFERSTAALRILRRLKWPWWTLYVLVLVPPILRDTVYDWIARSRYRWFGKSDVCPLPTPELENRFLS